MAIDRNDRDVFVSQMTVALEHWPIGTVLSWTGGVAVKEDYDYWKTTDMLGSHDNSEVAGYIFEAGGTCTYHGRLDS